MYNDKYFSSDSMDYEDDCLDEYNGTGEKVKNSIQTKFRHSERENYCFPYKKSLKLLKSTKRFRRKHFNVENDKQLQEIAYLNQLADTVLTNDSVVNPVGVSNMDKRISKLLDRIHYEIVKAKRKYDVLCTNLLIDMNEITSFDYFSIYSTETPTALLDVQPSLIDLSDFDCVLCYRTLWKPVVTPCGHTYCMVC